MGDILLMGQPSIMRRTWTKATHPLTPEGDLSTSWRSVCKRRAGGRSEDSACRSRNKLTRIPPQLAPFSWDFQSNSSVLLGPARRPSRCSTENSKDLKLTERLKISSWAYNFFLEPYVWACDTVLLLFYLRTCRFARDKSQIRQLNLRPMCPLRLGGTGRTVFTSWTVANA